MTVIGVAAGCLIVGGQANGATAALELVAKDSFARTVGSGWGVANQGGSWSVRSLPGTGFSVGSGGGTVVVDPGQSAEATMANQALGDARAQTTFALPSVTQSGMGVHEALQVRRQANGDAYRARIRVGGGGHTVLSLSKRVGSIELALGTFQLPFTVRQGVETNLQVEVTGKSPVVVKAKAWPNNVIEPNWQSSISDSGADRITNIGSVGLWTYVSGAASRTTVVTTSFLVSKVTYTSQPTAPSTSSTTKPPAPKITTQPPAPSTPNGSLGSAPVGSASYTIPSGALFVSASAGKDTNSGNVGSPVKTIAAALTRAVSGQTVVLRAGSYNEHIEITKPVTVQAYPHETVWMDGSIPITSWTTSGGSWVTPWAYQFNHSTDNAGNSSSRFVDPAHPMAAWADQVFVDGSPLQQVTSAGAVGKGSFYVDYGSRSLRIGSSPVGHEVRASNRSQAVYSSATNVVLRGFGVRRYASQLADSGAVRIGNARSAVQNLVITDNATQGLSMRNTDDVVDHVTVTLNGMLGVGANAAHNLKITNSIVNDNNTEHFKIAPLSGGVKITRSRDVTVHHNDVSNNLSAGIWFDESCYDADVTDNTVNSNFTTGIQVEISNTAVVADNQLIGNQYGLQIIDSGDVRVFNNEIGRSTSMSVRLKQDARRASNTSLTGHDPQRPKPDPTVPWLVRNIEIANNLFGAGGLYEIYAMDNATNVPADSMAITVNGNVLNRYVTRGQTKMVGWGGGNNSTVTNFDTPEALAAAKNPGWRNAAVNPSTDIASMGGTKTAYASIAIRLPSDIATLLGQPAEVQHLGRF